MVEINVKYQGNLRCEATHGPSKGTLITDAPVDNHGKGESFSPTDLVATALASCISTIMGIYANRHEVDLSGLKIHVEKHMSIDTPRRIARLPLKITMPAGIEAKHREALEQAATHCPVHRSLNADIETPVEFSYPD
jgi:uncharacterized OsmC-like protein